MRLNFWFKLTRFVKGSLPRYSNRQNYLLTWKCKQLISAMVMYIDTIYLLITFSRKYLSPLWYSSVQFNRSVVSDFVTPWAAAHQASLSITNSWSLLKLMSVKSMRPSNHLILCCPLLLLPSIFPSIRVFSNESVLHIRWQKYWSFSFSVSPSNEYSELISFRMGWLDLLAVQETPKSLLHHSSKASNSKSQPQSNHQQVHINPN